MAEKTSQGTILEPGEAAVTYREGDGYNIYLPSEDDETPLPQPAVVLIAVGMRLADDPEFHNEMMDWFAQRERGRGITS